MGSGVQVIKNGAVDGATATDVDVTTIGFRPRMVELFNETGLATAVWLDSMKDGEMLKTITAGTLSKVTSTGITPLANGFRIGQDADINVIAEKIHWRAHE